MTANTREIKFRAWYPGECWANGEPRMLQNVCISDKGYPMHLEGGWDYMGDEPKAIPMQYTGLKDKNGVEIFEGDILHDRYRKDNEWKPKSSDELEEVWWCNDNLRWQLGDFMDLSEAANSHETTLEVIGNIYENPELLERTNKSDE